ncbi:flagellar motor switch protein FliN [Methylococcus sp. EFPC2]|uniref:flagellar motor switch protein FliN n=1 Tax=Methylococcus sp. EFPC2 TaxID=2812648 RepID=UPI001967EE05|nr:flagellar motor switch protein FliN [Methylococcus sp. EFPC2]QSA97641.1 flagellar motor switch protein FliN [Methylococcus sp. EFPC2]
MSDIDADDILAGLGAGGEEIADDWAAAFQEQQAANGKKTESPPAPDTHAHPGYTDGHAESRFKDINLDVILDVPVTISIEVGRKRLNIRNLLQLTQGSLIELDRLQGEPMDVLVNGTLVAHGEVVVVNDKFGVRLTDVLSPSERVRKLK